MSSMPVHIQGAYSGEMTAARTAADDTARWAHLERAHILSQPYPWPHTRLRKANEHLVNAVARWVQSRVSCWRWKSKCLPGYR